MKSYLESKDTNNKYLYPLHYQEEELFQDLADILFESYIMNGMALKELLCRMERCLVVKSLWNCEGCQREASKILRIKPNTLCVKCKKYNITFKKRPLINKNFVLSST